MRKEDLKVGMEVVIFQDTSGFGFSINDTVRAIDVYGDVDDYNVKCEHLDCSDFWWVELNDIKPVE